MNFRHFPILVGLAMASCQKLAQKPPRGDTLKGAAPLADMSAWASQLSPPVSLALTSYTELQYRVPAGRFKTLLPIEFACVQGPDQNCELRITIAHYSSLQSAGKSIDGFATNEIRYLCAVDHKGLRGNFLISMQTSSDDATVLATDFFAIPADQQSIDITESAATLTVKSERNLFSLQAQKRRGWIRPLMRGEAGVPSNSVSNSAPLFYKMAPSKEGKELSMLPSVFDSSGLRTMRLKIIDASFPFAVQSGLLEPDEVLHPASATSSDQARLELDAPQTI